MQFYIYCTNMYADVNSVCDMLIPLVNDRRTCIQEVCVMQMNSKFVHTLYIYLSLIGSESGCYATLPMLIGTPKYLMQNSKSFWNFEFEYTNYAVITNITCVDIFVYD